MELLVNFANICDLGIYRAYDFKKAIIRSLVYIIDAVDYILYVLMTLHDFRAENVGNESKKLIVVTTRRHD